MQSTTIYTLRCRIGNDKLMSLDDKSIPGSALLGVWGISTSEIDVDVSDAFITHQHCVVPGCAQPHSDGPLCLLHRGGDKAFMQQLANHMVKPLSLNNTFIIIVKSRPDLIGGVQALTQSDLVVEIDNRAKYEAIDDDDDPNFPCDLFYERLSSFYLINCRMCSQDGYGTPEMAFLDYLFRFHAHVNCTEDLQVAVDKTIKVMTNYDIW